MSKHLHNFIALADTPEMIGKKLRKVITDAGDTPGRSEKNPTVQALFMLLTLFSPGAVASFESQYQQGAIRYGELKGHLAESMAATLAPIRERRADISSEAVQACLTAGTERAHAVATDTLNQVKSVLGLR